jgi:hypothetical protein
MLDNDLEPEILVPIRIEEDVRHRRLLLRFPTMASASQMQWRAPSCENRGIMEGDVLSLSMKNDAEATRKVNPSIHQAQKTCEEIDRKVLSIYSNCCYN